MGDELSITHERVDDIPVVFAMARRLRLPEILAAALGSHGNQEGLSYGWLATSWLAYMLVEGDHRKSVVEEWGQRRRRLLEMLTGQEVRDSERGSRSRRSPETGRRRRRPTPTSRSRRPRYGEGPPPARSPGRESRTAPPVVTPPAQVRRCDPGAQRMTLLAVRTGLEPQRDC